MALMIPLLGISCGLLAIFGGVFYKPWVKLKLAEAEARMATGSITASDTAARTARLEARVQVLERIVTDGKMDLANEIEALRSLPSGTASLASLDKQPRSKEPAQ